MTDFVQSIMHTLTVRSGDPAVDYFVIIIEELIAICAVVIIFRFISSHINSTLFKITACSITSILIFAIAALGSYESMLVAICYEECLDVSPLVYIINIVISILIILAITGFCEPDNGAKENKETTTE